MSRQPLHVIWPSLLRDGHVVDAAWRAVGGGIVGTCECGAHLRAGPSYPAGRYRTGYTAICDGCGHEYGALGPSDAPAKTTRKGAA